METLTLSTFENIINDRNDLINFLIRHNVLLSSIECIKCKSILKLNRETLNFSCWKTSYMKNKNKKRVKVQCGFRLSALNNTFFGNSHLDITVICRFVGYFLFLKPPRHDYLKHELQLSDHTVVDWQKFCREVCIYHTHNVSEKLGGEGTIVEIGETKISQRKCNRSRTIDGICIFGGLQQETRKCFVVPVCEISQESLLNVIKDWILPGTTIISDCWRSYNCLTSEEYQHFQVTHKLNFVDPDTSIQTQSIEHLWKDFRSEIPRYGTRDDHIPGYLAEFMFKYIFPPKERISAFFKAAAEAYPLLVTQICDV